MKSIVRMFLMNLLIVSILAATVSAGTPTNPDLVDPADPAIDGSLDIRSAWISSDNKYLVFTLQVADLSTPNPVDDTPRSTIHRYKFSSKIGSDTFAFEIDVYFVDTTGTTGGAPMPYSSNTGFGTSAKSAAYKGGSHAVRVLQFDPATHTITVKFERGPTFPAGTSIATLTLQTLSAERPFSHNTVDPLLDTQFTLRDTAGPGRTYVIG